MVGASRHCLRALPAGTARMTRVLGGDPPMSLRNVNTDAVEDKTDTACYAAVRAAMITALSGEADGLTFPGLCNRLAPALPEDLFPTRSSIRWYAKAVQIDLETGWVIERVPDSDPLRLRLRPEHSPLRLPTLRGD